MNIIYRVIVLKVNVFVFKDMLGYIAKLNA